jgi:hypothetical protein
VNETYLLYLLKKILRLTVIALIILIFYVRYYKITALSNNKKNIEKITQLLENNIKTFNIEGELSEYLFNNKITILSIFDEDNFNSAKIIKNNKELQKIFSNQINIISLIVKNNKKNDEILDLINSDVDRFINKNNILDPVFYVDNVEDFESNRIYIFDEGSNLKVNFRDTIDVDVIKNTVINISKENKKLKRKKGKDEESYIQNDEDFIAEFTDFILVEKNKLHDFSFFIILDSVKKRILFTTLNGQIVNMIDLNSFCLPNKIKLVDNTLYILDSCSDEIKGMPIEKGRGFDFTVVAKSPYFINASDFEFIDKNNILITKDVVGDVGIFNLTKNEYNKYEYKIGRISNATKYKKKIFFFDCDNNVLYTLDEELQIQKVLDFSDNILPKSFDKFLLVNEENIYFMDSDSNLIYFYDGETLEERDYDGFLYFPKNMIIYRNMYYILSENFIQNIDFFNGMKNNIYLSFSKYFKYYDINKVIENEKIFFRNDKILTTANNINIQLTYNDTEYMENSPSFLNVFEIIDKNTLSFVESFFLNLNSNTMLNFSGKNRQKYLFYGKIFYKNGNSEIKIKNIYNIVAFDEKNMDNNTIIVMF